MLSLSSLSLSHDRISELPDSILLHILSFLPAKDAVYTVSLLSKRWIHLPPFLHSLNFIQPTIVPNPEPKFIFPNFIIDDNHHHHHGYNQHVHGYPAYPGAPSPSNSSMLTDNWYALVDATLISYDFCYVQRICIQCHYDPAFTGPACHRRLLQVDSWVNYAVRRKSVKQLELLFLSTGSEEKYRLPRVLFRNETLTSLSLRSCLFRDCVSAITWTSLKTLSMEDISFTTYNSHILKKILVGCPVLECFKLVRCDGFTCLEIVSDALKVLVLDHCHYQLSCHTIPGMKFRVSTPNLSVLVISGLMWYTECTIEIGPCLAEATYKEEPITMSNHTSTSDGRMVIDPYMYYDDDAYYALNDFESVKSMAKEFLRSAQHVKKLSIGSWCLHVYVMEFLPYSFWSCKSLTLSINLKHWEIHGLAVLLQNCPKLESFHINMWTTKSDIVPDLPYTVFPASESNTTTFLAGGQYTCLEQHLKKVELLNLSPIPKGGTLVIEFLKFLLKRCRVLEKLSITTNKHCQSEQGVALDMFKENDTMFQRCLFEMLSNHSRSSRNAVIQVN